MVVHKIETPLASYREMELEGVTYRFRPSMMVMYILGKMYKDSFASQDMENSDYIMPVDELMDACRTGMAFHHSAEEIETFLQTATMDQMMALMMGSSPTTSADFLMPAPTG